jgi:hypothetical protein
VVESTAHGFTGTGKCFTLKQEYRRR